MKLSLHISTLISSTLLCGAVNAEKPHPKETEVWQPVPNIVTPYPLPSDAIVLFAGEDLSQWQGHKGPADWDIEDKVTTVTKGKTGIATIEKFCDVQLHIEWRTPPKSEKLPNQIQGNSGIYFQGRYEVQILDSFENQTYVNGQAGAIYKQHAPLVNATLPPMQWQSFDIIFTAPRFSDNGEVSSKGRFTVLHNGLVIQNNVEVQGDTVHRGEPAYTAHGCEPIYIQNKSIPVSFRNIWARHL